jgi:TRAP-type C4-dicarboxylate transport system permease small subunit
MRDRLIGVADRLQRFQLWLAALAMIVLMLVTVCDVFLRYLFNSPIRGSYDAVESLLLVFVFNAMAAAFFGRRHVVIDLLDPALGVRGTAILIRIADLLAVLCLCLMMWAMLVPAQQAYDYGDVKLELQLPIYALWAVALAGLAGSLLCALAALLLPTSRQAGQQP